MMIGNKKEERRVCTILLHIIRKSPTPSENRLTAILNWKKAKVWPGIWTRPVQTECHRSTTCATTTSIVHIILGFRASMVVRPVTVFSLPVAFHRFQRSKSRTLGSFICSTQNFDLWFCRSHPRWSVRNRHRYIRPRPTTNSKSFVLSLFNLVFSFSLACLSLSFWLSLTLSVCLF